jgi:hypothetical protein
MKNTIYWTRVQSDFITYFLATISGSPDQQLRSRNLPLRKYEKKEIKKTCCKMQAIPLLL